MDAPAKNTALDDPIGRSRFGELMLRLYRRPAAFISAIIVALYVIVGLLTFLPVFDRHADLDGSDQLKKDGLIWQIVGKEYAPPSFVSSAAAPPEDPELPPPTGAAASAERVPHGGPIDLLLGTDILGRSVFWHVIYGTRVALTIAVIASALSLTIGTVLGVLAGYFGGIVDAIIIWVVNTVSSVPWILLTLAIIFVLRASFQVAKSDAQDAPQGTTKAAPAGDRDLEAVILAMGLTSWVGLCRLVRGEVLSIRERDYVVAARAMGLDTPRILVRHILPNITHLIIITFSLGAVDFVQAEVVLTLLGLGISAKPSWGRMIDDAKLELLRGVWWQFAAATIAIFVLCLALNLLGDFLRDVLDPRLRGAD